MKIPADQLLRLETILEGPHAVVAEVTVWDYAHREPLKRSDGTMYQVEVSTLEWEIDGTALESFSGQFEAPLYFLNGEGGISSLMTGSTGDVLLPYGNTLRIVVVVRNEMDEIRVPLPWAVIWETQERYKDGVLQVTFRGLEALAGHSELGRDAPTKGEWTSVGNTVRPWVLNLVRRALPAWADSDNKLELVDPGGILGASDYIEDKNSQGKIPAETVWSAGTNLWEAATGLAASRSQARLYFDREGRLAVAPALAEEYGTGSAVGAKDLEMVRLKLAKKEITDDGYSESGTLIDLVRKTSRDNFANSVKVVVRDTNVVKAPAPVPIPEYDTPSIGSGEGPKYWDGRVWSPTNFLYPGGLFYAGPVPLSRGEYYSDGSYHGAWDIAGKLTIGGRTVSIGLNSWVYAVLTGYVAATRSDVKDNPPGVNPGSGAPANYVMIHARDVCAQKVTVVYYHLKQNSVLVSPGQAVYAGDAIARVGNSGNSTGAHLHIHVAKGWKTNVSQTWGKGTMSYPPGKHWGQSYTTLAPDPLSKGGMCKAAAVLPNPWEVEQMTELFENHGTLLAAPTPVAGDVKDSTNSYTATLESGPMRWGGPLGYARKVFTISEADPVKGASESIAKARLAKLAALTGQVEIKSLCYPQVDPGDVIAVEMPNPDDTSKPIETKYVVQSVRCALPGGVLEMTTKTYGRT